MKQPRLLFLAFIPLVIPIGCASGPQVSDMNATAALPALPADEPDSVRQPENVKAYPVGRYTDPDSPEVMHEAHTVYRAETSPQWNLAPNAPTAIPLGPEAVSPTPPAAVADPARQHVALTAELEQRLKQEDQLLQVTYEQNEQMAREINKLKNQITKLNQPEKPPQPTISTNAPELPPVNTSAPQAATVTKSEPVQERTWSGWFHSFWSKPDPTSSTNSSPEGKGSGTNSNPERKEK